MTQTSEHTSTTHETQVLHDAHSPQELHNAPDPQTVIAVDDVSMIFNIASEQFNSLKEYALALMKGELCLLYTSDAADETLWV